jgi:hypothetical protein
MIENGIQYNRQLKQQAEKILGYKIDDITTGKVDVNTACSQYLSCCGNNGIDLRAILNVNGSLRNLQAFKEALSKGFEIVGIDHDTSNMTSQETLDLNAERVTTQMAELKKLNAQGKNCIVLSGVRHLIGIRQHLSTLSETEQANYKLVYVHADSVVDDGLKNDGSGELEEWVSLKTKPIPSTFLTGLLPVHSYHISNQAEQEAFLKEVVHYVPESSWNRVVQYGVLALAAGIGLFAYSRSNGLPPIPDATATTNLKA